MSNYTLPMLVAFMCAICNGVAAVLQKISVDREKNVNSLDARLLWKLFQDKPYVIGIGLDLLGWLFTLYAVHYLPLFLVESIVATNIVITALVERLFRHHKIKFKSYLAIITIMIGITLLVLASSSQAVRPINNELKLIIVLLPIPVAVFGYFLARRKSLKTALSLAMLSGLAFGITAVVGRIFKFSQPAWHTIYSPLIFSLIASGILGILLFSIALQRAKVTIINATSVASQALIPALIGIIFLGDHARNGMWYLVVIGITLAISGVAFLALSEEY